MEASGGRDEIENAFNELAFGFPLVVIEADKIIKVIKVSAIALAAPGEAESINDGGARAFELACPKGGSAVAARVIMGEDPHPLISEERQRSVNDVGSGPEDSDDAQVAEDIRALA